MDHFQRIYAYDAERYERLIAREDQRGNLFETLMNIHPFDGARIVEFGAGTGRLTRIMSVLAAQIDAFDASAAMLEVATRIMEESGMTNWSFQVADNRSIPLPDGVADITIEGWSFGHVMGWHGDQWQAELDQMLAEMERLTRPGGSIILIETMGTGRRDPQPPNEELRTMYAYLEQEKGFSHRWIRTDYQFENVAEADELMRFFFGDEMADTQVAGKNIVVPECTGIWWKTR
jgi:ubiquinone/menaquinone biosynthesis C-methylase UbiE